MRSKSFIAIIAHLMATEEASGALTMKKVNKRHYIICICNHLDLSAPILFGKTKRTEIACTV